MSITSVLEFLGFGMQITTDILEIYSKKGINIAVAGATGVVGGTFLKILSISNFPIGSLHLLASNKSKGQKIDFRGHEYEVQSLEEFDFSNSDLVFGCVGSKPTQSFISRLPKNVVLIDEASFLRRDPEIPLIIPSINEEKIAEYKNKNIIASPNCCVVPIVLILHELEKIYKIKRVVVSTYQSCSGAGKAAMDELINNSRNILTSGNNISNTIGSNVNAATSNNLDTVNKNVQNILTNDNSNNNFLQKNTLQDANALQRDISFNVIPQVGKFDYYQENPEDTDEEVKVRDEIAKILGHKIEISVTAVRVPVLVGHSFSCNIEFEEEVDLEKIIKQFQNSPAIFYNKNYLTPKEFIGNEIFNPDEMWRNLIHVSRVRHSVSGNKKIIDLWAVGNNLTVGAALNLFQIGVSFLKFYKKTHEFAL